MNAVRILALLALPCFVRTAAAQPPGGHDESLGTVTFQISCSEPSQAAFNRGVALLHHMTYPEARVAFERLATSDPRCAMAHWGIAMTLFQPLWPTRPQPAELSRGWDEVRQAVALGPLAQRERLFVDAAEAFFRDRGATDYWTRIERWEQAMANAYTAFPDDDEVGAFYALAHLAAAPADRVAVERSERAAGILLAVLARNPDHPGAKHYLIHANDIPGREHESLEIVRSYDRVAPHNPHALHMPTHIYTRLGDWDAVIQGNLQAADAALDHPAGEHGEFVWDEFPHALEYLVYAYLQKGVDADAAGVIDRLRKTGRLQPSFKTAFHLSSMPARYALEREAWNEAAAIEPRMPSTLDWDHFMWPEAITWFARGIGAVRQGELSAAKRAGTRLEALERIAAEAREDLFARNIKVLGLEVNSGIAQLEKHPEIGVTLLREAVALEAATPKHAVTPAPTLPALELLGHLLLEQQQPAAALAAYRQALALYPGRFNGLLGAARAARAVDDKAQARSYYQSLLDLAGAASRRPALTEARDYLAR